MKEKKFSLSLPAAIVILSFAILFAATQISSAIIESSKHTNDDYQFELSRFNDNFEDLKEIILNK